MTTATDSGGLMGLLPARYSKFVTVLVGLFITYVTIYGWKWHLDPALVMIGTALGVYGVPNGPPRAIAVPVPVQVESTTVIEDVPPPAPPPVQDVQPPPPALTAEPGSEPEVIPRHV